MFRYIMLILSLQKEIIDKIRKSVNIQDEQPRLKNGDVNIMSRIKVRHFPNSVLG